MIRTWRGKAAAQAFQRQRCKALAPDIQRAAYRKLLILDAAEASTT